ncbi:ATPase [Antribacter sp. KLBMP9083]|uniref:ATPase n=1 Tax=Antribacter soli TaxID=2910976 RepID=A0AA41U7J0_9MICO|nr:ATPase [Antribacter soli]MCF4121425.1 ATPase [Antribacter soli]
MSTETVPSWPRIEALVREDGSGQVVVDGTPYHVYTASLEEARVEVLRHVTENAVRFGRAVRASAEGPEGVWTLIVHPDGTVVPEDDAPRPAARRVDGAVRRPEPEVRRPEPEPAVPEPVASEPAAPVEVQRPTPEPVPAPVNGVPHGDVAGELPTLAEAFPVAEEDLSGSDETVERPGVADWVRGATVATPTPPSAAPDTAPSAAPDTAPSAAPDTAPSAAPRTRREVRQSFLTHEPDEDPATRGLRGALARVGIRIGPSEAERAEREDERAVSQHWPGPRTVAIVNGKGGAGKTPSTVLLAAVFAQHGGAGVVTWDNNQTRGTLGWRTEQGPHQSTLLDLLAQSERLLGPSAQAADLARYVHHQTRDRFDVLRSKPMALAHEQRVEPEDVDAIHSVLSKYYRMIFIDSGNDESDPMWLRMIDHADQLVVATTTRDDHAEAGALLLEALAGRDGRSAYLAQQAVAIVSQADPKGSPDDVRRVAEGYSTLAREVVTVPFDPAMVDGHLRYGALRPATQRAWLGAGAAVARGL